MFWAGEGEPRQLPRVPSPGSNKATVLDVGRAGFQRCIPVAKTLHLKHTALCSSRQDHCVELAKHRACPRGEEGGKNFAPGVPGTARGAAEFLGEAAARSHPSALVVKGCMRAKGVQQGAATEVRPTAARREARRGRCSALSGVLRNAHVLPQFVEPVLRFGQHPPERTPFPGRWPLAPPPLAL